MRRRLVAAGAGLIISAALLSLFRLSDLFAQFFAMRISAPLGQALGRLSGKAPFPVFELLVMLASAALAAYLLSAVIRAALRRKAAPLISFTANLLLFASTIIFTYTMAWPARLYVSPFANTHESAYTALDLEALCQRLIERANALNASLPEETGPLEEMMARVPECVAGVSCVEETPCVPKLARYPELFQGLNIAGLYTPWTGEALVNPLEASVTIPFVACHEAAHGVGFAKEDDANFVAYLACMGGDAEFQYSGTLCALYYAMEMLRTESPHAWERMRAAFDEAVFRDFYAMNGFRDATVTELVARNEEIADAFLRFSGQNGLNSYPQMILRLLDYEG